MADLTFMVQSLSSAGTGRVQVSLQQVNPAETAPTAPGQPVIAPQPFYGSNLGLNLTDEEAKGFDVNQVYTLSLTPVAVAKAPTSTVTPA